MNCPVCTLSVMVPLQGGPAACVGCDKPPAACVCRKPLSPESFAGFDKFCLQLFEAEKEAKRRACDIAYGGDPEDELGRPINPYRALREILVRHARNLSELERHRHEYDDQDLCKMCGLDGRA